MSEQHHIITLRHDPDNPAAIALVDRIYMMMIPECRSIITSWDNGIEEHRFHIIG